VTVGRLGGVFSGLLGGVLNGDTCSCDEACGAREVFDSWKDRAAGLAGTLGFVARLSGAKVGLPPVDPTEEDNWGESPDGRSVAADVELVGVVGRLDDGLPDARCRDSREAFGGLRTGQASSPRARSLLNPRGGERGESTVRVGGSCGDDWKTIDMGLLCRLPGDIPGDPPFRRGVPFP
jgi:hypothetical protein